MQPVVRVLLVAPLQCAWCFGMDVDRRTRRCLLLAYSPVFREAFPVHFATLGGIVFLVR